MSIQPPTRHAQEISMLHNVANEYKKENERLKHLLKINMDVRCNLESDYFRLVEKTKETKDKLEQILGGLLIDTGT